MNKDINKTEELQRLMKSRGHKVKCSNCKAITYTDDLSEWNNHNEICFNCREQIALEKEIVCKHCGSNKVIRQGMRKVSSGIIQRYKCKSCGKKFRENSSIDDKSKIDELSQKFEVLMNLREQYFTFMYGEDKRSGIMEELEEYFDVDLFNAFCECHDREYSEFFNMGEGNRISWGDLESIVNSYKQFDDEEDAEEVVEDKKILFCKKCGLKINSKSLFYSPDEWEEHEELCNLCWNKKYEKEKGREYKDKKDNEKKRAI